MPAARNLRCLVLLLGLLASGTALRSEPLALDRCAQIAARPMLTAHLLLGMKQRNGRAVSEASWRRFLDGRITPRFPGGLTVLKGDGQWRQANGRLLREPARIVLIVAPDRSETVAALAAIRTEYMAHFSQDSAGLVLSRSCALF